MIEISFIESMHHITGIKLYIFIFINEQKSNKNTLKGRQYRNANKFIM